MKQDKVYLAMRFAKKEIYQNRLLELEKLNFKITHNWSLQESIKPYTQNIEKAKTYTLEDIAGVLESDIFILCAEKEADARGCYMEFGMVLGDLNKKRKIYIVVEGGDEAMFFFHPDCKIFYNWNDLILELKTNPLQS